MITGTLQPNTSEIHGSVTYDGQTLQGEVVISNPIIKGLVSSQIYSLPDPVLEKRVTDLEYVEIEAGEDIVSHKPIAIIGNLAMIYDADNLNHLFAFAGFSMNGALLGENLKVRYLGFIELTGWGLSPGQHYIAGANGALITATTNERFRNVIGYAVSADKMKIILDNDSIIIN